MSLHEDIVEYIRSGETYGQALGLEVEHFVVNDEGIQIGFDEVTDLIKNVAEELQAKVIYMDGYPVGYVTGGYSVTLEPACQFEISIDPKSDIESIKQIYKEFLLLWIPVFENCGYHMITKGNLPLVESGAIDPDDIPLSHKKRYQYMDAYFRESGKYGKYMMRASSSVQISVDYSSERDLVRKTVVCVCRKHVAYLLERHFLVEHLLLCGFRTIGKFRDAFFEFDDALSKFGVFGAKRGNSLRLFGLVCSEGFDNRLLDVDAVFCNNFFLSGFRCSFINRRRCGRRLWLVIKEFFEVHLTFCPLSSQPGYTNSRQSIGPLKNGTLVL